MTAIRIVLNGMIDAIMRAAFDEVAPAVRERIEADVEDMLARHDFRLTNFANRSFPLHQGRLY